MDDITLEQRACLELSEKYFALAARIETIESAMAILARDNRTLMKERSERIESAPCRR